MRIGIDGFNLAMPHGTGIASYGLTLARTLRGMGHSVEGVFGIDTGHDPALRELLFFDRIGHTQAPPATRRQARRAARRNFIVAAKPFAQAHNVPLTDAVEKAVFAETLPIFDRLISAPRLFARAHQHFKLYGRFLPLRVELPPDVMHWTYPLPVRLVGARNIYTLHDLVPLRLPYATLDHKLDYHRLIARCVRDADAICTVSATSASDIIARFGTASSHIVNTHQISAMPEHLVDRDQAVEVAAIRGIFGLERGSYYLFYGAIEPKKNLGRLLEAYLSGNFATRLVIVSSRGWQSDDELKLLTAAQSCGALGDPVAPRVIRLDHMSRGLLAGLVRCARAVLFPSLYEGFGLPALEAMQLGTPVLASNRGSLPEIVGDAAVMVDPYDVASIAQGLRRLEDDAGLRRTLAENGPRRAALFSESVYRERLAVLYQSAMTTNPR